MVYHKARKSKAKKHFDQVMPLFRQCFGDVLGEVEKEVNKGKNKGDYRCPTHVRLRSKIMLKDFQEELLTVRQYPLLIACCKWKLLVSTEKIPIKPFNDIFMFQEENVQMYSDCIGYLMLSNIDISQHFSTVMKSFPNLQVYILTKQH